MKDNKMKTFNRNHIFSGLALALALFAISFTSCTDEWKFGDAFLEKAPGGDVTKDTIFNNAEYTRNFLWSCYAKQHYGLPFCWLGHAAQGMNTGIIDALSDEVHSHCDWDGVNRLYYSGAYSAPSTGGSDGGRFPYMNYDVWECVRACYIFLNNVDRSPLEESEKTRLKAEAKCLIAERYFDLFRNYGGLPLVKQEYEGTEASYELPRATVAETVKFMTDLLDEAAPELPWSLGDDESNWEGRFTQAGAMGLKAKILCFAASPLFNNAQPYCTEGDQTANTNHQAWYGDYQESRWQDVVDACKAFFDKNAQNGNVYALVEPTGTTPGAYRSAFRKAYSQRGTSEVLISTRARNKDSHNWEYLWATEFNSNGGYTPTEDYMEQFDWKDGHPFDYEALEKNGDLDTMFIHKGKPRELTRDPRLYETMIVNGTLNRMDINGNMSGDQVECWDGGNDKRSKDESGQYATGMANNKFYMNQANSSNNYCNWPYLRMAEMYLIYAEALTQTGHITEAIPYVDAIRERVGLKGLKASGYDVSTKDKMIAAILKERNCEFGLEESRMYDMIRYRRADLFSKPLHGLKIRRLDANGQPNDQPYKGNHATGEAFPTHFSYERYVLSNKSRSWWTSFSTKWYLSAFPTSEINKGYGLTQNPGW